MKFTQHYSTSNGNLYTVDALDSRIIIDPGVSWKKLQKAFDYRIDNIDFALVSHEHQDHCKAVKELRQHRISVMASEGTLDKIGNKRDANIMTSLVFSHIGRWSVFPFDLHHDADEPQGFIISDGVENLLYVTDTRFILERFTTKFNIIAIECNYDNDVLVRNVADGKLNEELAKRISKNHMEKSATLSYLQNHCNLTYCREIHLLHMSDGNINKQQTVREFEDTLMIKVVTI